MDILSKSSFKILQQIAFFLTSKTFLQQFDTQRHITLNTTVLDIITKLKFAVFKSQDTPFDVKNKCNTTKYNNKQPHSWTHNTKHHGWTY